LKAIALGPPGRRRLEKQTRLAKLLKKHAKKRRRVGRTKPVS
jgi:hypothetical protein